MNVDIDKSAEMIYLAKNKEEGVSFKEIKALQSFGLPFNFEPETDVEILRTEILKCIWFYIGMYSMGTHVKSLEQMCVDVIPYELPFKVLVNRLHLELPITWFDDLFYRITPDMYFPCTFFEYM